MHLLTLLWLAAAPAAPGADAVSDAVFKIENISAPWDFATPWQRKAPTKAYGTGFLIEGGFILTNAHVVADAQQLLVKRKDKGDPVVAHVEYVGHDCDLALMRVEDASFFKGLKPLALGGMPRIRSTVTTYGYPIGGEEMSSTRGVVSRVEMKTYAHTTADSHIAIQTDAAINPGNSGGPVIQDGKVVGVAFQGISGAENTGFVIPVVIVKHFLEDIKDKRYDGYPTLGATLMRALSPALRRERKLPAGTTGMVVQAVAPRSMAADAFKPGDVITEVMGTPVGNDGNVLMGEIRISAEHLVDVLQIGAEARFKVWREGKFATVTAKARRLPAETHYGPSYETAPTYIIYAGLLFQPLSVNLMRDGAVGSDSHNARVALYDYLIRPNLDERFIDDDVILLTRILKHPANSQVGFPPGERITRVNGKPVKRLADLEAALAECSGDVLQLESGPMPLVEALDCKAARAAHTEILTTYGISNDKKI